MADDGVPLTIAEILLVLLLLCCCRRACGSRSRSPRWPGSACSSSPHAARGEPVPVLLGLERAPGRCALPLFIWMGEILYRTKLSEEMFEGLAPWLTWLPGR
jgi:hypothetical protein